jgi:uncharacterized protein
VELSKIHQRNLQTAQTFMKTLASGDMGKLMTFWAEDGILEFPFHPPGASDRVVGKSTITNYFQGTTGKKKPKAFPITGIYPMLDPNLVFLEFDGELENLVTGEQYTNKYCVLFKFNADGEVTLFREYFDSLKRQRFEM